MIKGWRSDRRIGPEPLHQRVRPSLLYASACTGTVTLLSGFYWLINSNRANIYVWCALLNLFMLFGIIQCIRVARLFDAATLLILSITITAAVLYVHGKFAPPVIIPT
ncbi:hypothetical protein D3C86_1795610 [compost metagenome]